MAPADPIACAGFLIAAFVLAGFAQTAWLASPRSRRFAVPLDGGFTLRGRRLLGENKTLRGFLVIVPAAAIAFAGLAVCVGGTNPGSVGLWPLSPIGYAVAGGVAGFGFMAGELPNSLVKRQLGIAPGGAARGPAYLIQFMADRLDSGLGMLMALNLVAPAPWETWLVVVTLGPFLHWAFSALMFHLGVKPRLA
jgi:CDP-2,3-bis-(O-geranylgeranyl)-sn-glycerol synthase